MQQYCLSIRYTERLAEMGIAASVGSAGGDYDNAMAETITGHYKAEVIWKQGPWKNGEMAERATLEWVHWSTPNACSLRSATSRLLRMRRHIMMGTKVWP